MRHQLASRFLQRLEGIAGGLTGPLQFGPGSLISVVEARRRVASFHLAKLGVQFQAVEVGAPRLRLLVDCRPVLLRLGRLVGSQVGPCRSDFTLEALIRPLGGVAHLAESGCGRLAQTAGKLTNPFVVRPEVDHDLAEPLGHVGAAEIHFDLEVFDSLIEAVDPLCEVVAVLLGSLGKSLVGHVVLTSVRWPPNYRERNAGSITIHILGTTGVVSPRESVLRLQRLPKRHRVTALPHVVWDMGGVMYRYFTELILDVGSDLGWPVHQVPLGPTGALPDPDYERLLGGEINERSYVVIVVARLAESGIDFDPYGDLLWHNQERPRTWETIGKIHDAGHRQAVLTNDASRWLGANWWDSWEHASWFEEMIDVTTLDHPKPHPEAYLSAARALGVPTEECMFVDDLPVNCRGAEATGMSSHVFSITDPEESMNRLEGRLGL